MNTSFLASWPEQTTTVLLRILLIVTLGLLLRRALRAITDRLIRPANSAARAAQAREQQTRTVAGLLYSTASGLILAVALLMILPLLGVNVTPVAAAAGLAALAVGFGGQHLVRDLINGFFIVLEDQFVVGDTIRVGDTIGRVEHLTLRRTVLRDAAGALITVPNGDLRAVANLSRDWSQLFVDVTIAADHPSDRALEVLAEACADFRNDADWAAALVDGPRVLGVEALTLAGFTLRVQLRTAPTRQHEVARELRRRIRLRFEQESIPLGGVAHANLAGTPGAPIA